MDTLNTKIKNIKTEKTLKVRPENIKKDVSIFGITGTYTNDANATANDIVTNKTAYVNGVKITGQFNGVDTSDANAIAGDIKTGKTAYVDGVKLIGNLEEDYAKFVEQDRSDTNYFCYIYKPTLQEGDLEDIEDIFENDNYLIQNLLDIVESDTSMIEDTLQNMDIDVLEDIITLCDIAYDLFLYRDEDNSYIRLLHIESTSSNSADIYNPTLDYGIYGISFTLETDAETGDTNVAVGEVVEFIYTGDADATASDILDGKTAYVNGELVTGTLVPSSSKNYQSLIGMYGTSYSSYTASSLKLTVAKTGTYTIEWLSRRLSTSGTYGTALYIDGTRYGSNYETWSLVNYRDGVEYQTPSAEYQYNTVQNVSLTQGQVVEIYGKSSSRGSWIFHHTLLLKEE